MSAITIPGRMSERSVTSSRRSVSRFPMRYSRQYVPVIIWKRLTRGCSRPLVRIRPAAWIHLRIDIGSWSPDATHRSRGDVSATAGLGAEILIDKQRCKRLMKGKCPDNTTRSVPEADEVSARRHASIVAIRGGAADEGSGVLV